MRFTVRTERGFFLNHLLVLLMGGSLCGVTQGATNFKKWLNEEVLWIISRNETDSFKDLDSDQAREEFVERFWLRRDPTPSTERNEYKEEHYRRLAYAEKVFREGTPGWKTDRGRIYILHGPPAAEYFYNSRSEISAMGPIPQTMRNPNTLVWVYHRIPNAKYYRGEIRLIFQPSNGLNRQTFALSESKTAQDRADQLARQFFPASDPNWLEADVRYNLVMAGPPNLINFKGADLPAVGASEFGRYLEDLFRSPGDLLEEQEKEHQRRRSLLDELKGLSETEISFATVSFEAEHSSLYREGADWLVPVVVRLGAASAEGTWEIYAALLQSDGTVFDEFLDFFQSSSGSPLAYSNRFIAPSGEYRLRVVVRRQESKATGVREAPVRLVPEAVSKIRFGTVWVTDRLEVMPPDTALSNAALGDGVFYEGTRLLEDPEHTFNAGDYLFVFVQTWLQEPGSAVSFLANFIRNGEVVRRVDPRVLPSTAQPYLNYGLAVPLEGFLPGQYTLQVQAIDHDAKTFAIERVPLTIREAIADSPETP